MPGRFGAADTITQVCALAYSGYGKEVVCVGGNAPGVPRVQLPVLLWMAAAERSELAVHWMPDGNFRDNSHRCDVGRLLGAFHLEDAKQVD
mgnify:CR=1 FL=1